MAPLPMAAKKAASDLPRPSPDGALPTSSVQINDAAALVSELNGQPAHRLSDEIVSASELSGGGCVIRIAGRAVEQVGHSVRRLLGFVPALLGDDPWSRKW